MTVVMRIVGLAAGGASAYDGKYVREYDPSRNGIDPYGRAMLAHVVGTDDPAEALRFANHAEAHRLWTAVDPRQPVRPDGKPNRPLTAFTVSTEPLP